MGTKNFSNANDLITFSRSSAGTALRKIAYGPELVTNGTFDTDTDWTYGVSSGWSVGSGVATFSGGTGDIGLYQSVNPVAGRVYAVSVSQSGRTAGSVVLRLGGTTNLATVGTADSEYSFFIVAEGANSNFAVIPTGAYRGSVDNISVKEVLFDDASGDLTLFNHPADIPRIEYDADGNVLGLLVEESRTNLSPNSNFNAGWSPSNSSLETDAAVSPDGAVNAVKLKVTTSSTHHSVYESVAGGTYAVSVFAKAGEYDGIQLTGVQTTDDHACFNLIDGTAYHTGTNASNATIEDFGNGWYRCSAVIPVTNGNLYIAVTDGASTAWLPSFAGANTTDGIYIYGAQIEAGDFPTSYIPTDGATATRSADVASIPVADFGYNQSGGSVLLEFSLPDSWVGSGFPSVIMLYEDGLNRFGLTTASNSDDFRFNGLDANVSQFDLAKTTNSTGESQKHIFAFESNSFVYVADSDTPSVDSSGTFPSISEIVIGGSGPTSGFINGHIKSIRYYPRRLTDAQLQELTT